MVETRWTYHAKERLDAWEQTHGITKDVVEDVLDDPPQVVPGDRGALVAQAPLGDGLLRVVFVEESEERRVLTVYWTSQVRRYWIGD